MGYKAEHPEEYAQAILMMKDTMRGKKPNAAHLALAKYKVPVITMNIDGLHQKAGSETVIECHGNLEDGTVVLYGQEAFYDKAFALLKEKTQYANEHHMRKVLLVVGTSYETQFANAFVQKAMYLGWALAEVNHDAERRLPPFLKQEFEQFGTN